MSLIEFLIFLLSLSPFVVMRFTKTYFHFTIFAIIAVTIHGLRLFGAHIFLFLVIVWLVSTFAELLSLKTKFNFFGAKYRYNLNHAYFSSHINLLGVYPIEISLTWVLLKYISFVMGLTIVNFLSLPNIALLFLVHSVLLSLDFIIDPVAVKVAKMCRWESGGNYFGIPLGNFIGWYAVGLIASQIIFAFPLRLNFNSQLLLLLPAILYMLVLQNVRYIVKLDRVKALIGLIPGIIWIFMAAVSLFKLT